MAEKLTLPSPKYSGWIRITVYWDTKLSSILVDWGKFWQSPVTITHVNSVLGHNSVLLFTAPYASIRLLQSTYSSLSMDKLPDFLLTIPIEGTYHYFSAYSICFVIIPIYCTIVFFSAYKKKKQKRRRQMETTNTRWNPSPTMIPD